MKLEARDTDAGPDSMAAGGAEPAGGLKLPSRRSCMSLGCGLAKVNNVAGATIAPRSPPTAGVHPAVRCVDQGHIPGPLAWLLEVDCRFRGSFQVSSHRPGHFCIYFCILQEFSSVTTTTYLKYLGMYARSPYAAWIAIGGVGFLTS